MSRIQDAISVALGRKAAGGSIDTGVAPPEAVYFDAGIARSIVDHMDAGDLYATQPHLRTVINFVARNGAQLGRHMFTPDGNGGRARVTDSAATRLLAHPNEYMTGYDLFNHLISELAIYDFALWVPRMLPSGDWAVDPIPGEWITGVQSKDAFRVESYRIQPPNAASWFFIKATDAIVFRGYSPHGFKHGSTAVRTLKGILSEQVASYEFREQMWKRGGRVGMYMSRPKDAPTWSPEAKNKFIQDWRSSWSGDGGNAGGTPLLEDGMTLSRVGFTSKDEQWLDAATLSLTTCASSYHIPPAMVGVAGFNSFASVKEFRKMLYTETLGPLIAQIEDTWNTFLLPMIGEPAGAYLELNIAEKLQGDFEEQAAVLQAAVGGPYMAMNEARARVNLPAVEGGDEVLVPLNMTGATDPSAQGAPTDDGKAATTRVQVKADENPSPDPVDTTEPTGVPAAKIDDLAQDLKDFFARQRKAIKAAVAANPKAKDPAWWNSKHWNTELAAVLHPRMLTMTTSTAHTVAKDSGLDPAAYSVGRTTAFLKAVADSRADLINSTTRDQVSAAIKASDESDDLSLDDALDGVFDDAEDVRSDQASKTMTTMLAGWATVEVASQLAADKSPQKTWVVQNANPRPDHAEMDGETVGIDEPFSNGANWPGDPVLGAEGVANCDCGVTISYS